ncbi:MAG: hypothetical protein ABL927_00370 [Bdellovibrionales bacterium]
MSHPFTNKTLATIIMSANLCFGINALAEVNCSADQEKYSDTIDLHPTQWCQTGELKSGPLEVIGPKNLPVLKAQYENNLLEGKVQKFYDDGSIMADGFYSKGQPSGRWVRRWPNGNIRDSGVFKDGEPVGVWEFFNDANKLIQTRDMDEENALKQNLYLANNESKLKLRTSFVELKPHNFGPSLFHPIGEDRTKSVALGLDYLIWYPKTWFKIHAATDYSHFRTTFRTYSFYNKTYHGNVDLLFFKIGAELSLPFFSQLSFGPNIGRVWTDFSDTDNFFSVEFRYRFKKNLFKNLNSVFVSFGNSGGNNNNNNMPQNPGPYFNINKNTEADVNFIGLEFAL